MLKANKIRALKKGALYLLANGKSFRHGCWINARFFVFLQPENKTENT